MAKIAYIGTPDDDTQEVTAFGMTFERGKPIEVSDKHPSLGKLKANQTFADTPAELKAAKTADAEADKA